MTTEFSNTHHIYYYYIYYTINNNKNRRIIIIIPPLLVCCCHQNRAGSSGGLLFIAPETPAFPVANLNVPHARATPHGPVLYDRARSTVQVFDALLHLGDLLHDGPPLVLELFCPPLPLLLVDAFLPPLPGLRRRAPFALRIVLDLVCRGIFLRSHQHLLVDRSQPLQLPFQLLYREMVQEVVIRILQVLVFFAVVDVPTFCFTCRAH